MIEIQNKIKPFEIKSPPLKIHLSRDQLITRVQYFWDYIEACFFGAVHEQENGEPLVMNLEDIVQMYKTVFRDTIYRPEYEDEKK